MEKIKKIWLDFEKNNPNAARWLREGGLFFLVSNLITLFKYLILTFLPSAFAFMGDSYVGFPGIEMELFGQSFRWSIVGGEADYFTAYMIAMVIGEVINFFMQRKYVFRSTGNILYQGLWYLVAFCIVTCVVTSINSVWIGVADAFVAPWIYNIGTTILNGGVSMVVFFFVNKKIFPEEKPKEAEEMQNM